MEPNTKPLLAALTDGELVCQRVPRSAYHGYGIPRPRAVLLSRPRKLSASFLVCLLVLCRLQRLRFLCLYVEAGVLLGNIPVSCSLQAGTVYHGHDLAPLLPVDSPSFFSWLARRIRSFLFERLSSSPTIPDSTFIR